MLRWLRRLFFELSYVGSPRWDTGETPPELRAFIRENPPGRALDLGCGTGTNLITLAAAGWEATGVDFSRLAVRTAREKARRAGVQVKTLHDDVSRLHKVAGKFDLILDIGCFHSLTPAQRSGYARGVIERLADEGLYMLYAFIKETDDGPPGTTQSALERTFSSLDLERQTTGVDGERTSAWLWFRPV